MALTAQMLFDSIQISNSTLFGPPGTEIFDIKLWDCAPEETLGTLYILEADGKQPRNSDTCWLRVPHGFGCEALRRIQALLTQDYHRSILLSRMYRQSPPESFGAQEIGLCAQIIGNPIWLLNCDLQIIARSPDSPVDDNIVTLRRDASLLGDGPALLEADDTCPCRRMLCPICRQGSVIGYLLAFQLEHHLLEQVDAQCLQQLSQILSGWMRTDDAAGRSDAISIFIMEILRGQVTDSVAIAQRLKDLRWPHSEKYYVLSVDTGGECGTSFVSKALSSILHSEIYVMGRYCLALLGCPIKDNLSAQDFPELLEFLSAHGLFAGLSNGFLELTTLRQAFDQSVTVIPLRQRFSSDVYLARYEDLILIHLIDTASKNGVPLQSLCHPLVVNISNYDQEHGTDYLRTLAAYVLNNMSIQQSADVLFIHRNTMHYRVNNLKELFHIDFSNARLFMKLRISVSIYSYLGHVKLTNLWGPFN